MAKQRDARPVHRCRRVTDDAEAAPPRWFTSCGLKLSRAERGEVVLAEEWEFVTCKDCKKKKKP